MERWVENIQIVIFDGTCNFCNGSVNFIIARDPESKFNFAPMQGESAKVLMKQHGIDNPDLDTFLLIKDGKLYQRTDAALEIAKDLTGYWKYFQVFRFVPAPLRDIFYLFSPKTVIDYLARESPAWFQHLKFDSDFWTELRQNYRKLIK